MKSETLTNAELVPRPEGKCKVPPDYMTFDEYKGWELVDCDYPTAAYE